MDKWLKKRKLDDNNNIDIVGDRTNEPIPSTSKNSSCSQKYVVSRKYNEDFLKFGFTSTMENYQVVPECVICGSKLSNSSMVPSKLQRHLVTNHPSLATKDKSYFEKSLSLKLKQVKVFEKQISVSGKAQLVSYEIAELLAVKLKPHNLAEEIILPACRKIVKTMIGESADINLSKIPLSNDTIHRRIKDMSQNIEENIAKTLGNSNFALQIDETTDITGKAHLIAFVRFIHENDIINQFLCCRELHEFTTGKNIFNVKKITSYLEEIKVSWKLCIGICTDGAPAMTGHLKGFVALVRELSGDILVTHCFLHREALVTRYLPSELKIVLEQCVKMINYIKSRPLKSRLFTKLCQAMEAKYESLLLHTEVSNVRQNSKLESDHTNLADQEGNVQPQAAMECWLQPGPFDHRPLSKKNRELSLRCQALLAPPYRIIHTTGGKSPRLLLPADVTRLCPPPHRNAVFNACHMTTGAAGVHPSFPNFTLENPRTTLLELEQDTGISKTTIGRILPEDLKLKKTPAKFIPRFLTNEQKLCRLATCEDMLEMTRTDPEWKDKIITGDETWVYGYYPETKRQSAEWRCQGEPRPKEIRILKSRNKVLLVVFLDNKGIVHHEYLPAGQTVIKEMYLGILRRLREAFRKIKARKMD
ncbi:hypothetical protein LAZ67_9002655 [Cordylochernes scorpioides]|uniref:Transposase n=1 Tax=Cordylochernes scorpioides TaxID=51811 RepID=A0ABY6KU27_9ARAC|nr:hypothetical protein LAZ67_9002655 [Cordylochernes scorpioides]